ncbi:MAG: cytochrome c oxidase assembly protein [Solirubrobacterales bacterium]|nr:cytochrome c oxidase assembly protein [Solirubrobacterales bacterium]MBV9474005.1 cytochrome c oxidase assembly protein [Solirubrobacterales bacterium]MBV9839179.1 cytochrome c oxidase assembly protein [Solirubrobacterales bacterium]
MAPRIAWSLEPSVLLGVAAVAVLYVKGWRRGRAAGERHRPGWGRLVLFAAGLSAVLVALVSPVDQLGEQLLVMHMLQHILLLDVAPILMILGLTKVLLRPVTRRLQTIERQAGVLAHPAFAVLAYAGLMWLWHIPSMYDAALRNASVHALEHLCFAGAGALYWWHVLSPIRARQRLGGLGPIAYMVSTKLLVGALGIVLAFSPHAFYPFYEHGAHYWGLTAAEDQSLAGLEMALEQSIVMGIALAALFVRMLAESEREAQRAERLEIA